MKASARGRGHSPGDVVSFAELVVVCCVGVLDITRPPAGHPFLMVPLINSFVCSSLFGDCKMKLTQLTMKSSLFLLLISINECLIEV